MMEEETIIKSAGVLTSEIKGELVEVTIKRQDKYDFNETYFFDENAERASSIANACYKINLGSVECVEVRSEGNMQVEIYLKGCRDSSARNKTFEVQLSNWKYIKKALELSGFTVDAKEEDNKATGGLDLSNMLDEPTDEEINKMISLVDLDTFNKIIKNRLYKDADDECSDYYSDMPLEELEKITKKWAKEYLRDWAIAKYNIYKLLGDKIKIEEKIEVEPSNEEIRIKINDIASQFPLYSPILNCVSMREIANNTINLRNEASIYRDADVKDGMKFTKLMALYKNDKLNMALSTLYQDIGKTTLFLSIDPVDFLTVSINTSGWESCHNFFHGCYKNAGLSYMVDETSLVAYTTNNTEVTYSEHFPFKWNTKNWRQMVYISKECSAMVFSRQYPFDSNERSKKVRRTLEELFCKYKNVPDEWKVFQSASSGNIDVDNGDNCLAYNDVDNGWSNKAVRNKYDIKYSERITIFMGGTAKAILSDGNIYDAEGAIWTS